MIAFSFDDKQCAIPVWLIDDRTLTLRLGGGDWGKADGLGTHTGAGRSGRLRD